MLFKYNKGMYSELTYKEIAQMIGKSESAIRNYKQKQPELLEALKRGCFCIKHDIDIEQLKAIKEFQKAIKKEKEVK